MKFLKLNKLNEDFFDEVEVDNEVEIDDDNEYEFSIQFKPECGSREIRWFVHMIPFDNMLNMFNVVCSHFSFCTVSEISFSVECEKYKKQFTPGVNSPSISETITQFVDVSMNRKQYQTVAKVKPLFTYSVKFSVPFKLKDMRMFKKDMLSFTKWYYSVQHYYTAITTDTSCYKDCVIKKNGEILHETTDTRGIQFILNNLRETIIEESEDNTETAFNDYLKKVNNVKNDWKSRFYYLEDIAQKDGIANIKLEKKAYQLGGNKNCRVFVYNISEVSDNVTGRDICEFVYNNTVKKFSFYDKICISENGKINQPTLLIYLICDEEISGVPESIRKEDEYAQFCGEIRTTIMIIDSEQAKDSRITYYTDRCE